VRSRRRLSSIPATVAAFAALGLAAVAIVAVVAGVAIRRITDGEALREARQLTRMAALSAVVPDLTDRILAGDPPAQERLDRALATIRNELAPLNFAEEILKRDQLLALA